MFRFCLAPLRRNACDHQKAIVRNLLRRPALQVRCKGHVATLGALTLGAAGAMAQTAAPVPNASGSQVTNPGSYGDTKR
jgi:hypothetical protein